MGQALSPSFVGLRVSQLHRTFPEPLRDKFDSREKVKSSSEGSVDGSNLFYDPGNT